MMIVAEIGGNHFGHFARAVRLIDAAKEAGADAVKFQCFSPNQMADHGVVIESGPWAGRELLDLYQETYTPREWFPHLFHYARRLDMLPFSSVFHPDDVDFLQTIDCPIYKISSFELTDRRLIRHAGETRKPVIISTGMATRAEIFDAVVSASAPHNKFPTLLKCTSAYPSQPADANLASMRALGTICGCAFGLSDHSLTTAIPVAAAALGATVIEKHLTINRMDSGPDAGFSLEPDEFAKMVADVRDAVASIGCVQYGPLDSEASSLPFRRQSGGKRGG